MASPRLILEVYIQSIHVVETGDRKTDEAQNALLALLNYPLPGKAEVLATTGILDGLYDDEPLEFDPPKLFIKEYVLGATDLLFTVTDRDDRNRVVSFLRRLGSAFVGSAGEVVETLVPGVLRAAFQEAVVSGKLAISDRAHEKVEVVATGELVLHELEEGETEYTVELFAPQLLSRREKPPIAAGEPNGQLELLVQVRPA